MENTIEKNERRLEVWASDSGFLYVKCGGLYIHIKKIINCKISCDDWIDTF